MFEEHGLLNLHDFEARARTVMRKSIFDMVDGGFNDEITYTRTRPAFDSVGLIPRYLKDVSHVDTSTELLGQRISLPVLPAPSAPQIGAHPDGDLATCRAAGTIGTIEIVSHGSDFTIEEVTAAASGPVWCNIFMLKDRDYMRQYVRRAEAAGCTALCWTIDTPSLDMLKEQMLRNPDPQLETLGRWANLIRTEPDGSQIRLDFMQQIDPAATWHDLDWLRSITALPIVVKGVLRADDAQLCVRHGASGIVVSNHGARLVDGMITAIEALPEVVDAVGDRCAVLMDGGIRRGLDVFKALALGATAVLIGRPIWYGLAVGGQAGVEQIFRILQRELAYAMTMSGVAKVEDCNRELVVRVPTLYEAGGFAARWTRDRGL